MFKAFKKQLDDVKLHYGVGFNMAVDDFSQKINAVFIDREFFDEEFFEEIEETLIELDIVPNLAIALTTALKNKIYNQRVSKDNFDKALREVIDSIVKFSDNQLELEEDALNVFLIVGINGVGKTTTISKVANIYKHENLELVAADTFRAGAINQLNEWATRLDIPITKTHQGHSPSAVIYEAIESANKNNRNLLICDTAGRLHNKDELMQELKKIHSVIEKNTTRKINLKTIIILDGTSGKNTIEQAKAFNEITKLDGIIVTKLDSTSKVGMIINVLYELRIPVLYVTKGESIEDIEVFDYQKYLELII